MRVLQTDDGSQKSSKEIEHNQGDSKQLVLHLENLAFDLIDIANILLFYNHLHDLSHACMLVFIHFQNLVS